MLTILDYSAGVPPAAAIRAAGHDGVIRYISPPRASWMLGKPIQRPELDGLQAHGLGVAFVWQFGKEDELAASAGVKGTLPPKLRPVARDVDFFLTSPEKRSTPGWCTITKEGVVSVNFSDPAAKTGYGMGMYIRDFAVN